MGDSKYDQWRMEDEGQIAVQTGLKAKRVTNSSLRKQIDAPSPYSYI